MPWQKNKMDKFVICVNNEGYLASLELRKIYQVIPDEDASTRGFIRVVDESGEDYLYSKDSFVPIEIPQSAQSVFVHTS
jgi:hypothetical protein